MPGVLIVEALVARKDHQTRSGRAGDNSILIVDHEPKCEIPVALVRGDRDLEEVREESLDARAIEVLGAKLAGERRVDHAAHGLAVDRRLFLHALLL